MAAHPEIVVVRSGETELELAPATGGSVFSFRVDGFDVLRPGSTEAFEGRDARELAAFPLFPFSGRIADARFRIADRLIQLDRNFPPEPHAIHGRAWQNPWRLAEVDEDSARLFYESDAADVSDDWPWAYRAEQLFSVAPGRLRLALSITNRSDTTMPAGLGWHPYFPSAEATLTADLQEIWRSGDDMIPDGPSPLDAKSDLRRERRVSTLDLDNAFSVGDAATTLAWSSSGVRVRLEASSSLRHLIVFTPPGEDFFCVEPVSHAPDALNSSLSPEQTGFRELDAGETLAAEITLHVSRDVPTSN